MSLNNITPAGAFVDAIAASASKQALYSKEQRSVEKHRKPWMRNAVVALLGMFGL